MEIEEFKSQLFSRRFILPNLGAMVAQSVMVWSWFRSPLQLNTEIFSIINRVTLHKAFYYHRPIILIRLKYC